MADVKNTKTTEEASDELFLFEVSKDLPAYIVLTATDDKGNPFVLNRYMADQDEETGDRPEHNVIRLVPKLFSSGSVGYMASGQEDTKGAVPGSTANLPGSVKHNGGAIKFQMSTMWIVIGSKEVSR